MKRIPGFYHLETAIANAYYIQTGMPKGGWGPNERAIRTAMVLQQVAAGLDTLTMTQPLKA